MVENVVVGVPAEGGAGTLALKPALRLHGGQGLEIAEPAAAPADTAQRIRAGHRFDLRSPALRLVGSPAAPAKTIPEPGAAILARLSAIIGLERFAGVLANQLTICVSGCKVEARAQSKAGAGMLERRFAGSLRQAAAEVLGDAVEVCFVAVPAAPSTERTTAGAPGPPEGTRPPKPAARSTGRVYRLDDFVVGNSNRLAYNVAVQCAEAAPGLGTAAAPLLIHGPCGVGKTHLLHGIARRFRERQPGAVVRVVTGEAFLNEFIVAIGRGGGSRMTGQARSMVGTGGIERFRRTYRRCDLLCIDDVHFLARKEATQQELLHTFDQIAQSGAKIVLACDRDPRDMKSGEEGFSAALVSRFLSGMVAGIEAPDPTVREQAARMFAQRRGLVLEEAAVRLLVEQTENRAGAPPVTVRDVEGLVTRLEAARSLSGDMGRSVGVLMVERALSGRQGSAVLPVRRPLRAEQIIGQTCLALGVERAELGAPTRHKRVVLARAAITHLCRELTTMSFPEIARALGRPSHSTVITAFQRMQRQIAAGEVFGIGPGGEAMTIEGLVRQLAAVLTAG